MSVNEDAQERDPGAKREIAALRAELAIERAAHDEERRRAQRWEREAVLRASTVAGTLAAQVLAAHRLAAVLERNLQVVTAGRNTAAEELREALQFFREVERPRRRG